MLRYPPDIEFPVENNHGLSVYQSKGYSACPSTQEHWQQLAECAVFALRNQSNTECRKNSVRCPSYVREAQRILSGDHSHELEMG